MNLWDACECGSKHYNDYKRIFEKGKYKVFAICLKCGKHIMDEYEINYKGRIYSKKPLNECAEIKT